ncbi:hypothetical protein TWF970_004176 [Orbilia oligospora]|uniref:Uncharacterized protein n=1 Tax=Orbilia oligospora TaxID=2813651 RepID=A0A7C8RAU0_ORBOL|nr:hypothetical protein TWF970_004176 [Orbilia oligospora]
MWTFGSKPAPQQNHKIVRSPFHIAELLELILIFALEDEPVQARFHKTHQLRKVSKFWLMTIDSSFILKINLFRTPVRSKGLGYDPKKRHAEFCEPYISHLKRSLGHIRELKRGSKDTEEDLSKFQKALFPVSNKNRIFWWKNSGNPKSLIPDICITQPAVRVANLRFEGTGDIDGLDKLGEFGRIEPRSSPRGARTLFRYDFYIKSPDGITARDLNTGIQNAITTLFSHSGKTSNSELRVQKIEVQVNHTYRPIRSFAGNWGLLTTRTLWIERTMQQRSV